MSSPIDLPLTITSEIIKNSLDSDVMLSKNTKIAFSRIGGVFILYISHIAHEICKSKGRTKISLSDIKESLAKAGFEDFIEKIDKEYIEYEKHLANSANNKKEKETAKEKEKEIRLTSVDFKEN